MSAAPLDDASTQIASRPTVAPRMLNGLFGGVFKSPVVANALGGLIGAWMYRRAFDRLTWAAALAGALSMPDLAVSDALGHTFSFSSGIFSNPVIKMLFPAGAAGFLLYLLTGDTRFALYSAAGIAAGSWVTSPRM